MHRHKACVACPEFIDPVIRLQFIQPRWFIIGNTCSDGVVVGAFNDKVRIQLNKSHVVYYFIGRLFTLTELGAFG